MTPGLVALFEGVVALLVLVGAAFALVGSIGLARFGDFYMRLHGPSKSTTLGVGSVLAGSALYFSTHGVAWSLSEILVSAFLFLTTPASAHLLAKAALHLRIENRSGAPAVPRTRGGDETATVPRAVAGAKAAAAVSPEPPAR